MIDSATNIYAIDLGNTYSAIAWVNPNTGLPEIIPDNETAEDKISSAVFFKEDGDILVGSEAEEEGGLQPDRLLKFYKRWIGRNSESRFFIDGEEKNPIMLSAIILSKIKQYAMQAGHDVRNVVLTCPVFYDWQQIHALKQAGEIAGLNVQSIVYEPSAAIMAYCRGHYDYDNKTILVFDLGGGKLDLSVYNVIPAEKKIVNIQQIVSEGNPMVGGIDWTQKLLEVFQKKYIDKYGIEWNDKLHSQIRVAADNQKRKLSLRRSTLLRVIDPICGQKIELEVTREEFERASVQLLDIIKTHIDSVQKRTNIALDKQIDKVLLVGRATLMPMIQNLLIKQFGDKIIMNPDAIVKGAAIIANMDDGVLKEKSMWLAYPYTINKDILGMRAVYAPPRMINEDDEDEAWMSLVYAPPKFMK